MPTNVLQNLIDSGLQFTEVQRKQAEKVVRELVKSGEVRRDEAAKTVESLIERGRETSLMISEVVRAKSASSSDWLANRVDDLEDQVEESSAASRGATRPRRLSRPLKQGPGNQGAGEEDGRQEVDGEEVARIAQEVAGEEDRDEEDGGAESGGQEGRRVELTPSASAVVARRRLDAELVRTGSPPAARTPTS